jgi:23S rRNA (adenine2030-N6)-methyltransferase
MFAYRHAFHAGNHADVLKHLVLVQLLQYMNQKDKPYWYIDTHAGAGLYSLASGYATQNAEFASGVSKLWGRADWPAPIADYLDQVHAVNQDAATLAFYPGSPMIAQGVLRAEDKLRLFELHPSDSELLLENFPEQSRSAQKISGKPGAKVFVQDGFSGLKAMLPPPTRRACVLIDPPYEDKADYGHVLSAVKDALQRFPGCMIAVWYPLLQRSEPRALERKLRSTEAKSWLHVSLQVSAPALDGFGMFGSGLFILNPPYTLHDTLKNVMPVLVKTLGQDQYAGYQLEQRTG